MNQPLTVASIDHTYSITTYAVTVAIAASFLTGITDAVALTAWLDPAYATTWAVGLAGGGLLAFAATITRGWTLNHRLYLEFVGAATCAVLWGFYVAALWRQFPGTGVWITKLLIIALAVGMAVRAGQCLRDRGRLLRAVTAGIPSNPSPLADPTTDR